MKIAVVGSRSFGAVLSTDPEEIRRVLQAAQATMHRILLPEFSEGDILVSGGADGADRLAELWARKNGVQCEVYPADWTTHGRKAGFIRNQQIVDAADRVIAFWDGASKGTKHTLTLAENKGIPVLVHEF